MRRLASKLVALLAALWLSAAPALAWAMPADWTTYAGTTVSFTSLGSNTSGSSTDVITTGTTASSGQLVVVFAASDGTSSNSPSSVADSASNTYTAGTLITLTGALGYVRPFYSVLTSTLNSGGTITITYAVGGGKKAAAAALVARNTASPLDVQGAGTTGSGTAPSISTGTLGAGNEIVFGFINVANGGADIYTEATGFQSAFNVDPGGSGNGSPFAMRVGYYLASGTASVPYAPTLGTSQTYGANVITFKGH